MLLHDKSITRTHEVLLYYKFIGKQQIKSSGQPSINTGSLVFQVNYYYYQYYYSNIDQVCVSIV